MIKKILLSAILVVSAVQMSVGANNENDNNNGNDRASDLSTTHSVSIIIHGLSSLVVEKLQDDFIFDNLTLLEDEMKKTATRLTVSSNRPWEVVANITSDDITENLNTIFKIYEGVEGEEVAPKEYIVGNDFQLITSDTRGANQIKNVSYGVNPGYNLDPGTYNVNVKYTLTQP